MKRLSRRSTGFASLAAITAVGLALTGCAAGTPSGDGSDGDGDLAITAEDTGASLTLWVRPGNEAVTDAVVDAYNSAHENQIEITHVPADQYITKFAQASQTGDLPDILAADLVFMPQVIDTGAAVDLTDLLAESGAAGNLSPAHIQASTAGGRTYGVPYVLDTSLYLYNKTLFSQAGLDPNSPPTTWEGIKQAAAAIDTLGSDYQGAYISAGCAGCLAYSFAPTIWAQGTDIVNADGSFDFTSTEVKNSLEFLRDLYTQGSIPESARTDGGEGFFAVFAAGKTGFNFSGGNGVNTSTLGTDPAFEFGLAAIPGPTDGEFATFSGGDVASIMKSSTKKNEAWHFVEWLTSQDTSQSVYLSLPALPPRSDADVSASLGEQFTVPAELVKSGQTFVTLKYNEVIASAQGPWLALVQAVVFDGADIDEATQTAQTAADAITE
jgi:multiple sugar transport system substrate-binding protein